jgi:hypothetical protein
MNFRTGAVRATLRLEQMDGACFDRDGRLSLEVDSFG